MTSAFKNLIAINPRKSFKTYIETSVRVLKNLSKEGLSTQGSVLHGHLIKMGLSSERYIAVRLLIMYLNCRKIAEVNQIIKEFDGSNLIVYNCLISANVDWGNLDEARRLFDEMPERNDVSWTALISGLMKYGRVKESMWYFARNPFQDFYSWTAAISGLVQNGLNFEALKLFRNMLGSGVLPNDVTFTSVIRACKDLGYFGVGEGVLPLIIKVGFEHNVSVSNSLITLCLRLGEIDLARRIFDQMEKRDVVSWTAILDLYAEKGDLREARRIFNEMPERNEVSWSAMIARYSQSGCAEEASKLFRQMIQDGFSPNISCFSSVINALASLKGLQAGRNIHGHGVKIGIERNVFVGSSLIDLYCRCEKTEDGRLVFDSILEKNVVCWNSMVTGYSLNGQTEEAKELFNQIPKKNNVSWNAMVAGYLENEQFDDVFVVFQEMLLSGETPNKSTFSSILCACARIASLEKGEYLHGKIVKLGMQYDTFVGTALTDMYAKSGDIESSKRVFNRMPEKNEISWTAIIQGLAENGSAEESLILFEEMERSSGIAPNELILSAVLFACSHCGLVDKGLYYFNSMEKVYGIKPNDMHYTRVVDMLSRAGRLSEAENFVTSMPFQSEANAWAALLSGCKTHADERIAERAARKLSELAEKPGGYVLLSNIYASAGKWLDVLNIRKLMKDKGLKKSGGCSWVEVRNQVHLFYSQDGTHSQSAEIYDTLELLNSEMLVVQRYTV
ncbi:pentatricopeptide repeat-containing protein At5g42450, mitochondrial-like [Cornus florida]|uniref:pentatricopeptide repeat-containing protein At5g42450, mitochondrial-like n=1 Tax=Cornus florida TaxID=4283 RepID=UPI0028A24490|nr:pentatricopeptide repeat-containing protein At5g42450, mitochondrial-like [Cornus florida]XP_059639960.1 pentatricopeptide repeat-containing protein At5g42450, mitochondrial-like [Cornus florida]